MTYASIVTSTPQTQKASPKQVKNSAGGYSFALGDWERLDRFLILGTMGGSYYASEQKLTQENKNVIEALIVTDGVRVVNRLVEISDAGRAHKNDHALFVLAMASVYGDVATRRAAYEALPKVARIPTFLFKFLNERQELGGGWGRGLRRAVARIYEEKDLGQLAYHVIKYRQREGWTHRDVLRKSHPVTDDADRDMLFKYIVDDDVDLQWMAGDDYHQIPDVVVGYEQAKECVLPDVVANLVRDYSLPREAIPTQFLTEAVVWDALLEDMPLWAMVRNLRNMAKVGLLVPGSDAENKVVGTLQSDEAIRKSRIHPMHLLLAIGAYSDGVDNTYASGSVLKALDDAYHASFGNIEATGQRILVGLDISGSMGAGFYSGARSFWGHEMGFPGLDCATIAAAMAMVNVRSEEVADVRGFSTNFIDLGIKKTDTLKTVLSKTTGQAFGGTDCSLPMSWAAKNNKEYDAFLIYTDNETWAGRTAHPHQALVKYRQKMGIPAKMVVTGIVSNGFSIADPNDAGSLDVIGFDAGAPTAIAEFLRG